MYCVYLIKCKDDSYYCGITLDINRRLIEHNNGTGSKYTRTRLPVYLLYSTENKYTKTEALKLEYQIKKLPKMNKLNFIKELDKKIK